jgi:hypothetical protein
MVGALITDNFCVSSCGQNVKCNTIQIEAAVCIRDQLWTYGDKRRICNKCGAEVVINVPASSARSAAHRQTQAT